MWHKQLVCLKQEASVLEMGACCSRQGRQLLQAVVRAHIQIQHLLGSSQTNWAHQAGLLELTVDSMSGNSAAHMAKGPGQGCPPMLAS